jgi:hypothetical protein
MHGRNCGSGKRRRIMPMLQNPNGVVFFLGIGGSRNTSPPADG